MVMNRNMHGGPQSTGAGVTPGSFAPKNLKEPSSGLAKPQEPEQFTNPNDLPLTPIKLRLQRESDFGLETVEEVEVDGRTLLAGMSREDMDWHIREIGGNEAEDVLLENAQQDGLVKDWDGPFEFEVGAALSRLQDEDPALLDQLSDARLDPSTYYTVGADGRLQSAEESHWEDLEAQQDVFTKAQDDLAHLQLRPFVQDFEKVYPDAASVVFAHDGDDDAPLFVSAITMKDGTSETHDNGSIEGEYPAFSLGYAIRTDREYSLDEIRRFRPKR
jgi:hypothetical protein